MGRYKFFFIAMALTLQITAHGKAADICLQNLKAKKMTSQLSLGDIYRLRALDSDYKPSLAFIGKPQGELITKEKNREQFMKTLQFVDQELSHGRCELKGSLVFIYPHISYAISLDQLKNIRSFGVGSRQWQSQVLVRLSIEAL